MSSIELNQVVTKEFTVTNSDSAKSVGSGGMEVLASPTIVAWVENTTYEFIENNLDPEFTSVGVQFELFHNAPTLIDTKVTIEVKVIESSRNKVKVEFKVSDNYEEVAIGTHTRVVVNKEKFLSKALKKNGIR